MKWTVLMLLPLCVAVMGDPNVTHPEDEECCDICELLADPNSEFYVKCGYYMHDLIRDKIQKDCARIKALGVDEDMAIFVSGLKELCYYKTYTEITFSCPEPPTDCDKCESIAETECGQCLHPRIQLKIIKDCRNIKSWGNHELYEAFWLNLAEFCDYKGLNFEEPPCLCDPEPCDICEELLNTYCVSQMDPIIQQKLVKDCKNIRAQGWPNFQGFWHNLAELCLYKNDTSFQTPECPPPTPCNETNPACVGDCDYCAVIADPESEFQQACAEYFNGVSPGALDEKIYDCQEIEHNTTHLGYFIDDLLNECIDATNTYFEFCRYEPPVIVPPPLEECMNKEIDVIFLVDSSNSIGDINFGKIRLFLESTINGLHVTPTTTRCGIITFSVIPKHIVELKAIPDKLELIEIVRDMPYRGSATYTDFGIQAADRMFAGDGRPDATKVLVLITDGKSNNPFHTYPAMQEFRANHRGAIVIAVGIAEVGIDSKDVFDHEIRAMATGLADDNVFSVSEFDDLFNIFIDLTKSICVPVEAKYHNGVTLDDDPDADPTNFPCTEVLFAADKSLTRWRNHYGVYELQEDMMMCEGIFVYRHTAYDKFMFRRSSNNGIPGEPMWQVRNGTCSGTVVNGMQLAEMVNDQEHEDPLTDGLEVWRDTGSDDSEAGALTTCFTPLP